MPLERGLGTDCNIPSIMNGGQHDGRIPNKLILSSLSSLRNIEKLSTPVAIRARKENNVFFLRETDV